MWKVLSLLSHLLKALELPILAELWQIFHPQHMVRLGCDAAQGHINTNLNTSHQHHLQLQTLG